jgi:hypothetical protein
VAAFATFDAQHHALTIDVRHLQLEKLTPPQACPLQCHQHRPVVEILRARNQLTHFVGAEDRRQPSMPLRGWQLLLQCAALEHTDKEEAQGRHVESDGPDGELLLSKELSVVTPERGRAELIKAPAAMVALTRAERV